MIGRDDRDVTDPAIALGDADALDVTDPVISERVLDGRYVLVRRIARGGMSIVYLAHHVGLGRPVALKILRPPPEVRGRYDFAGWFKAEARTLAGFSHPNVVTTYDFGPIGPDGFFLAMEFVDGPSLSEVLKRGPLDAEQTAVVVRQVCKALRYAHQRGVVHCDVKPSNVLLGQGPEGEPQVKVIDFGIAEVERAGRKASDTPLLGSPHTMAPEQVLGDPVTPATDVYGVGVLLVRCLTGKVPFKGRTTKETLDLHLAAPVPALAELAPAIRPHPGLESVARVCLQKDPAARFPDMDALIAALDAAVPPEEEATGSLALDPSLRERRVRPAPPPAERRVGYGWAVAFVAVLAVALGVAVFLAIVPRGGPVAAPVGAPPLTASEPPAAASEPASRAAGADPAPPTDEVAGSEAPAPVEDRSDPTPAPGRPARAASGRAERAPSEPSEAAPSAPPEPEQAEPSPKKDVPEGYMGMPEF